MVIVQQVPSGKRQGDGCAAPKLQDCCLSSSMGHAPSALPRKEAAPALLDRCERLAVALLDRQTTAGLAIKEAEQTEPG